MNCPYCKVPLMGGMTACPKCKYDQKLAGGGEKHLLWLLEHGKMPSEEQKTLYKDAYEKFRAENSAQLAAAENAAKRQAEAAERLLARERALPSIMISSGFNFDGYRIVKYSGYISGDDAVQIPRSGVFGGHNGSNLTNALVRIRRQALRELKEAAFDLGCNAVIGVDFDYITLEPETANISGGTLYEPYVICVTANGNAVQIEKIEEGGGKV
ncbi:MAG: heavy metal-binding domain-containing protein [Oscillospiraceae bacterium]|nr:heavy metal-binding domain-containing protein [Oscillospiraceae bacterium]